MNKNKCVGAIIGTAIGDALGAPMETMWASDIAKFYPHFNSVDCKYVAPLTGRRLVEGFKRGQWTDDTQLMIPTIESIIEKRGIHIPDIADRYADVFEHGPRGWGRSTIASIKNIINGASWFEASENVVGTGNGPPMKAAPLGLFLAKTIEQGNIHDIRNCLNSIVDVGKITHKEHGIRAGLLQAILIYLAHNNIDNISTIINELAHCEYEYFGTMIFSKKISDLNKLATIKQIAYSGGVTSKAEESWPTTVAVYLKIISGKIKPIKALFSLIREGGDCDTTGAILGSLIGTRFGIQEFPKQLSTELEANKMLYDLSYSYYETLTKTNKLKSFSFGVL